MPLKPFKILEKHLYWHWQITNSNHYGYPAKYFHHSELVETNSDVWWGKCHCQLQGKWNGGSRFMSLQIPILRTKLFQDYFSLFRLHTYTQVHWGKLATKRVLLHLFPAGKIRETKRNSNLQPYCKKSRQTNKKGKETSGPFGIHFV